MNAAHAELPSCARLSPSNLLNCARAEKEGAWVLDPIEEEWRDRQPFLASRGYMLRPRYRPGWIPSWHGTNIHPSYCEDSIEQLLPQILDARRLDGTVVGIKRTKNTTTEIAIALFLASEKCKRDPRNHCVSIYDNFSDPLEPDISFIVMPLLRPFDDPEFGTVGEVLDFIGQTLEGLMFLHSVNVAHRDCVGLNIMMDARTLYPKGWHPVRYTHAPNGFHDLPPASRLDAGVRYLFIDWGLSTRFFPGERPLVTGVKGRDQDVPELSSTTPYDAFKVDIFILGHVYQTDLYNVYYGLDFLLPIIRTMMANNPQLRPTAEEAFNAFQKVYLKVIPTMLRTGLHRRDESIPKWIYNKVKRLVG
ncbi:hypothetical protein JAAARDRAFT_27739 [Jaapia argillacea MUCL 33604]|uniref:Protein kinase domain-containing protein n=1 Tax=Jaapia argillacea MUCL 33604 TaxID=933084 RepID=A0A067QD63_9AGAM|nr:hypothetical protein JAAARDRAFT_27739 [Jaapia argillacea MUCL 33604]